MENSLCLYRKYRPRNFEDLVGQEHIKRTLVNSLLGKRFVHAYLFSGPRGTGKTSTARLLAKALNCLEPDPETNEPCGVCHICKAVEADNFLDIIEIDAASHTGIDNVREEIQAKVGYMPTMGKFKVYIIDEVHMLSTKAFNALLKTLEEPPGHVVFVLATTEPHKVPATVSSRCQRFTFRRVTDDAVIFRLRHICQAEGITIDDLSLAGVTRLSGGGVRDAISLLDKVISFAGKTVDYVTVTQVLGIVGEETLSSMFAAIFSADYRGVMEITSRVEAEGFEMARFAAEMVHYATIGLSKVLSAGSGTAPGTFENRDPDTLVILLTRLSVMAEEVRKAADPVLKMQVDLLSIASGSPAIRPADFRSGFVPSSGPRILAQPVFPAPEPVVKDDFASPVEIPLAREVAPPVQPAREDLESPGSPGTITPGSTGEAGHPDSTNAADLWPRVLDFIKKASPITHALFKEGIADGIKGGRVLIRFDRNHAFHHGQLKQEQHSAVIAGAMTKVFGEAAEYELQLERQESRNDSFEELREKVSRDPKVQKLLGLCKGEIIRIIPKDGKERSGKDG